MVLSDTPRASARAAEQHGALQVQYFQSFGQGLMHGAYFQSLQSLPGRLFTMAMNLNPSTRYISAINREAKFLLIS
jgi:hypothetical protein